MRVSKIMLRVSLNAVGAYGEIYKENESRQDYRVVRAPSFNHNWPIGFFDGASQDNGTRCGSSVYLNLRDFHVFKLKLNCGRGTNT